MHGSSMVLSLCSQFLEDQRVFPHQGGGFYTLWWPPTASFPLGNWSFACCWANALQVQPACLLCCLVLVNL